MDVSSDVPTERLNKLYGGYGVVQGWKNLMGLGQVWAGFLDNSNSDLGGLRTFV